MAEKEEEKYEVLEKIGMFLRFSLQLYCDTVYTFLLGPLLKSMTAIVQVKAPSA